MHIAFLALIFIVLFILAVTFWGIADGCYDRKRLKKISTIIGVASVITFLIVVALFLTALMVRAPYDKQFTLPVQSVTGQDGSTAYGIVYEGKFHTVEGANKDSEILIQKRPEWVLGFYFPTTYSVSLVKN